MYYDYLIVGAGLFGSVFAREAINYGKTCYVIDRRNHIAGNTYTKTVEGINVHVYGAHIFHTSNRLVWEYLNQYCEFNNFVNSPLARYRNEVYNLPFNMNTFAKLWDNASTPDAAQKIIKEKVQLLGIEHPANLEEYALSVVGEEVYLKLIKGYTEKQWGKKCKDLPASILKRIPLRYTFNNNYFDDKYQGIPIGGYTKLVEKLLDGAKVQLGISYKDFISSTKDRFGKVIYTGAIDEFFDYKLGSLEYRSVKFETEILNTPNFQGNAVVNYTEYEIPYTRIIEHKHFEFGCQPKTVISYEYPIKWHKGLEPYYPFNDIRNKELYKAYVELAHKADNIIFGGRLGSYSYCNMDKVIEKALQLASRELLQL